MRCLTVPHAPGSSPLTRGALPPVHLLRPGLGLIPAYAGSTHPNGAESCCERAHPRLRGEHHVLGAIRRLDHGSSPLTRGTHATKLRNEYPVGLIPAYAGNTPARDHKTQEHGAHPRLRGEH